MKRLMLIAVAALVAGLTVSAQNAQNKNNRKVSHEQMVEKQTDVLVKTLVLDDKEAQQFKVVYSEYKNNMKAIRDKYKTEFCRNVPQDTTMCGRNGNNCRYTDEEVEAKIMNNFKCGHEILNCREKYYKEFRKFLSPQQIQKMYNLEKRGARRFNKHPEKRMNNKNFKNGRKQSRMWEKGYFNENGNNRRNNNCYRN